MNKTINPKALQMLLNNQKECETDAPVTTRATFKLFELEALLKAIRESHGYQEDHDTKHSVCITLVREVIGDSPLGYDTVHMPCHQELFKNVLPKSNKKYTQLIPIITGCECILHGSNKTTESFKYLRDKEGKAGVISFVRPGGEGTGLIPPPPTGNDDDFS